MAWFTPPTIPSRREPSDNIELLRRSESLRNSPNPTAGRKEVRAVPYTLRSQASLLLRGVDMEGEVLKDAINIPEDQSSINLRRFYGMAF